MTKNEEMGKTPEEKAAKKAAKAAKKAKEEAAMDTTGDSPTPAKVVKTEIEYEER